jgi:hypothetical protein
VKFQQHENDDETKNLDDSRSFMDWNQPSKFDEDKKDDIEGKYLDTKI